LISTTDEQGFYEISGTVSQINSIPKDEPSIMLRKNRLSISLSKPEIVRVSLFNIRGWKINDLVNQYVLKSEEYYFPVLKDICYGIHILRIKAGGKVRDFKMININPFPILITRNALSLLKKTDVIDTLEITAAGYDKKKVTVSNYVENIDIILLASPSGPISVKIMTFNAMWEENGVRAGNLNLPVWQDRRPLVQAIIDNADPDIIGFQEASPEQQAGLLEDLPDYSLYYDLVLNNTNPIMYKTVPFTLISAGTFIMNDVPEIPGTNIGQRKASWVQLEEKETHNRLYVYNVHLDHRGDGSTRQISVVRLSELMATHAGPRFMTGDFNTSIVSPTMEYLLGNGSLIDDEGKLVSIPFPFKDAFREAVDPDAAYIDHVLYPNETGFTILDASRIPSGDATDHPVFTGTIYLDQ
jgi:endonuclease/exonuclease/phosphatase family metal-dependent hydrolase